MQRVLESDIEHKGKNCFVIRHTSQFLQKNQTGKVIPEENFGQKTWNDTLHFSSDNTIVPQRIGDCTLFYSFIFDFQFTGDRRKTTTPFVALII